MKLVELLVLVIIVGCVKVPGEPVEQRNIIELKESVWDPEPEFLTSQTDSCEVTLGAEPSQRKWFLSLFIGGRLQESAKDFFDLLTGHYLKDNQIVFQTIYGEESLIFSQGGLRYRRIMDTGKEVKLCPGRESYPEDSVENAALNVNYFVTKTGRRVQSAAPRLRLPPVKLVITPKIKEILSEENRGSTLVRTVRYQTDNATYDPSTGSISFLPHARLQNFFMKLWEIPIVPSHEYGHHVFMKIFTGYPRGHRPRLQCFGENHQSGESAKPVNWEQRRPSASLVLDALNEGFADLVAHYTLDDFETDLTGVPCLETSRSVTSEVFSDGIKKTFSPIALESFFARDALGPSKCEVTNFQEVHTFGAIFAHSADKFLTRFTEDKEIKLKTIIRWLQQLSSKSSRLEQKRPEVFFRDVFVNFLQFSVDKFDREFDAALCQEVDSLHPGLSQEFSECKFF